MKALVYYISKHISFSLVRVPLTNITQSRQCARKKIGENDHHINTNKSQKRSKQKKKTNHKNKAKRSCFVFIVRARSAHVRTIAMFEVKLNRPEMVCVLFRQFTCPSILSVSIWLYVYVSVDVCLWFVRKTGEHAWRKTENQNNTIRNFLSQSQSHTGIKQYNDSTWHVNEYGAQKRFQPQWHWQTRTRQK